LPTGISPANFRLTGRTERFKKASTLKLHASLMAGHHMTHSFMKTICLLFALIWSVQQLPAQTLDDINDFQCQCGDVSYAPLLLFTNGPGRIFPFEDGQMLEVGREYSMIAIPDRGYVFTNWTEVNVFTFIFTNYDAAGNPVLPPVTSTVLSPVPTNIKDPILKFTMPPEIVLANTSIKITQDSGWQANFVPESRERRIRKVSCDSSH
jgi:hypothetical protein